MPWRIRGRASTLASISLVVVWLAACKEQPIRVDSLEFEGIQSIDQGQLRAVLATQDASWIPFSRKPPFNQDAFQKDLERIGAFYSDRGYPDARVSSTDVRFNDDKDAVRILVRVDEGEPVRVADVRFTGFDVLPERRLRFIRRSLALEPGDVRDRQRVVDAAAIAVDSFKDYGYPYAEVETREEPGEQARSVVLVFDAAPGPLATFGEVAVQGNESVPEHVVTRQLTFRPGDRYSLSRVQESQRQLQAIELFSFAYVEPRGDETRPPAVPVRVTVAEGKHQRVTFGVGYGTEDKVRARVNWRHVNFLGDARTASAEAKWSSLDRGVRFGLAEPHLFNRHLSLSAEAQAWDEDEPVYRVRRYGGRVGVTWQQLRRNPLQRRDTTTSVAATFIHEFTDSTVSDFALGDPAFTPQLIALGFDPETGSSTGTLSAIRLEALRNTSGRTLDPRRGYLVRLAYERAGGFLPGDFEYDEVTAEGRHYLRLGRALVLATRARVGGIGAPPPVDASVPFFKRYFLGGSTSLRGWGRFEVSPVTASGTPIGGLTMLETNAELRMSVTDKIGVVGFVDAGNVWERRWDIDLGDLRADVGMGLRYNTPIGPVRGDIGYQLTPVDGLVVEGEPQTRRWRIHLSIGQAF